MALRTRYMNREITHAEYYGALVNHLGESALWALLPGINGEARTPAQWQALIDADPHLNNVALATWDARHEAVRSLVRNSEAFRAITGSGGWSLSDSVCVLKEAARRYASHVPTFPAWQHKAVQERPYPSYGKGCRIRFTAGLHYLQGNSRPYFTLTGEVYRPGARDVECCGQIHDLLLPVWPELAPLAALHLSDDHGVPMHAEANGWYWLAGYYGGAGEQYHGGNGSATCTPEQCLQVWADLVRVSLEEARALALQFDADPDPAMAEDWRMRVRGSYRRWINEQAARWQWEADAGVALLQRLGSEKGGQ